MLTKYCDLKILNSLCWSLRAGYSELLARAHNRCYAYPLYWLLLREWLLARNVEVKRSQQHAFRVFSYPPRYCAVNDALKLKDVVRQFRIIHVTIICKSSHANSFRADNVSCYFHEEHNIEMCYSSKIHVSITYPFLELNCAKVRTSKVLHMTYFLRKIIYILRQRTCCLSVWNNNLADWKR